MNHSIDSREEMPPASADQIVFRLDLEGYICAVNKSAEELTGFRADELTRLHVLDLLPGKSLADLRAIANCNVRQRFGTVFEIEITTSDRRQIRLEVSLALVRRPDGKREFRGLAVPKFRNFRVRPRCLDTGFQFKTLRRLSPDCTRRPRSWRPFRRRL